jgi:pimeloyl-ACP methyl ester carboxylesterase
MTVEFFKSLGPHGFHRIAYACWSGSERQGRPIVCVHGLTRNGRDFDVLAERLSQFGPVAAPDMPGRGISDWLTHAEDYGYALYLNDVAALIARIGAAEIDFVGTSMGGIIGMLLASQPNSPIRRLVLNDVGPLVPRAALDRIGRYVGLDPSFPDIDALEAYLRRVHAPFGTLTDAQWRHLAAHSRRALPDGNLGLAYDPAIGASMKGANSDVDLWSVYDRVTCPVLVIRGAESDLLLADTAEEMTRRGPRARLYEVAGAGHAPALMAGDQIDAIEGFLRSDRAS